MIWFSFIIRKSNNHTAVAAAATTAASAGAEAGRGLGLGGFLQGGRDGVAGHVKVLTEVLDALRKVECEYYKAHSHHKFSSKNLTSICYQLCSAYTQKQRCKGKDMHF
jgi:Spy/CpxP family protein refolding chaperone